MSKIANKIISFIVSDSFMMFIYVAGISVAAITLMFAGLTLITAYKMNFIVDLVSALL